MLVVSPLIALMKDQLAHLPPGLPGAMLWSGQQASEALKTLAAIKVYSFTGCVQQSVTVQMPYTCSTLRLHGRHVFCMGCVTPARNS